MGMEIRCFTFYDTKLVPFLVSVAWSYPHVYGAWKYMHFHNKDHTLKMYIPKKQNQLAGAPLAIVDNMCSFLWEITWNSIEA